MDRSYANRTMARLDVNPSPTPRRFNRGQDYPSLEGSWVLGVLEEAVKELERGCASTLYTSCTHIVYTIHPNYPHRTSILSTPYTCTYIIHTIHTLNPNYQHHAPALSTPCSLKPHYPHCAPILFTLGTQALKILCGRSRRGAGRFRMEVVGLLLTSGVHAIEVPW